MDLQTTATGLMTQPNQRSWLEPSILLDPDYFLKVTVYQEVCGLIMRVCSVSILSCCLDEAHLSPPFEALLRQIAAHCKGKFGPKLGGETVVPPFHLISLSATGREVREIPSTFIFRLEKQDQDEPAVHQRLTAR